MAEPLKIIVLEGDETGQELLEQSVRVLDPDVLGLELELEHYDLSLEQPARDRQRGRPRGRARDARGRLRPQGGDDHARGQGRRRLAEPDPARGGRRQGDRAHRAGGSPAWSGRSPACTTRSRSSAWRSRTPTAPSSGARATRAPTTRSPTAPRRSRAPPAARSPSTRSAPPSGWAATRVYGGPKWTVSPVYEGMLKEELDAAAARHPDVPYQPVLIDATYAGLLTGATDDAARDPGPEPRRRLPVGPRAADVRLDRRRRVDPARLRRRLRRSRSRWPRRRTAPRRR